MIFRRRETRFRAWSVQQSRMGKKIQIEKPEVATGKDEKIPEKFLNDIPLLLSSYFYYISKIGKREREIKSFIEYIKILEKSRWYRFREMGHRDCAQKSAPFNCNHAEHRESFVDLSSSLWTGMLGETVRLLGRGNSWSTCWRIGEGGGRERRAGKKDDLTSPRWN